MLVEFRQVNAECDTCGFVEGPSREAPEWFASFDVARDELAERGWSGTAGAGIDEDAALCCPTCAAWQACADTGHVFTGWERVSGEPVRYADGTSVVTWRRFCERCEAHEDTWVTARTHHPATDDGPATAAAARVEPVGVAS